MRLDRDAAVSLAVNLRPQPSMGQINDWMNELYEKFVAAHGIIIMTPVYWYQAPGVLKLMIDRLVCADGGNPDPTSTHGKQVDQAKELELAGWDYPKHLADRAYGVIVHGDVAGIEMTRRGLTDWLDWMGLIDSGSFAKLDRFLGYYNRMRKAMRCLTAIRIFRKRCAMWRAPSPMRWVNCVPGGCRSRTGSSTRPRPK